MKVVKLGPGRIGGRFQKLWRLPGLLISYNFLDDKKLSRVTYGKEEMWRRKRREVVDISVEEVSMLLKEMKL